MASLGIYQSANATETVEHGINYDDTLIGVSDGKEKHQWTSVPERIFIDGKYQDYKLTDSQNSVTVETGGVSWKLSKQSCTIKLFHDRINQDSIPIIENISYTLQEEIDGVWTNSAQNNYSCDVTSNELPDGEIQVITRQGDNIIGFKEIEYRQKVGGDLESILKSPVDNMGGKKYGFAESHIKVQDVIINDERFDLNSPLTVIEKEDMTFVNNNITNDVIVTTENQNGVIQYNSKDSVHGYLTDVTVKKYMENKLQTVYDFHNTQPLESGKRLEIDPTYGYTSGTKGGVKSNFTTETDPNIGYSGGIEYSAWAYWDITTIPDTATITNVNVRYDISVSDGSQNCNWRSIEGNLSTLSAADKFSDIHDGTVFVSNSSQCDQIADDLILDLGTSADSDIQAELATDNEWGIGIYGSTLSGDNYNQNGAGKTFDLQVTYTTTIPPWAVTTLAQTSQTATSITMGWTQPYLGGGNQYLLGYQINKTTPFGTPLTVLVNDTGTSSTTYTATGLTAGTKYSFRISAWTNKTNDHPYSNATGNIINVIPLNIFSGVAPTTLVARSNSVTQIDLQWVAGAMQNIIGYRIERETPSGSGWNTILGNTSNTNIYYNNTGLTSNIIYNYRVSSINATGISGPSNEYEMTTYHKPNAVTTLAATADDFTSIELDWTEPISYAPAITDYQINYTSPEGLPQTIIVHSPPVTEPPYTVLNLAVGDGYSFRISPITVHGMNASGNIANATTTTIFELGNLDNPDVTNTNDFKIFYTRTNTNSTSIMLDVTYPEDYNLSCNMLYKFSRENNTYTNLTETPVTGYGDDTDNVKSTFIFNGANNEIININCRDTITGDSAKYIITITQFELLDQLQNFRNGTYGTSGQIGGLDLITVIIVIIGMIGFNRVTPIAGVVFTCITVGVAAYFEIIEFYQIMFPAIALVILLAYTRTRQSD